MTLNSGYGFDLDTKSANWGVTNDWGDPDIEVLSQGGNLRGRADGEKDLMGVFGPNEPTYQDCAQFTGWTDAGVKESDAREPVWVCLRSNQGRYAKMHLLNDAMKDGDRHQLDVTTWE